MTTRPRARLRNGWPQTVASLAVLGAAAVVIAASSWTESQTAGRLAIGGVALFALMLILGVGRLVALGTVPVLAASFLTFVGDDDPAWISALVVGVLCYLATELAWDAIERRDGVRRTGAYNGRRIDEVTVVVALSLAVSAAAFLLEDLAPPRTVVVFAIVGGGVAVALAASARAMRPPDAEESSPTDPPGGS